jgi:ABC-type uncharacterized transport system ATPase subunit
MIEVRSLSKVFRVHERAGGLAESIKTFFKRKYRDVAAVANVSFSISPGEIVGFLGPNGAGKTTTLKMLAGLGCFQHYRLAACGLGARHCPRQPVGKPSLLAIRP